MINVDFRNNSDHYIIVGQVYLNLFCFKSGVNVRNKPHSRVTTSTSELVV